MNPPPASKSSANPPGPAGNDPLATLQEQQQAHKLELDALRGQVAQTRGLLQTLVAGLVIAVLTTLGIVGWFAYRQMVQERVVQRESAQAAEAEAAITEQLEAIEAQLQRQQQQLQTLRDDLPEELETLGNSLQSNQRQVRLLQERIEQLEAPAAGEGGN
ncbi:MAG: hypothetical protein WBG38_15640 [Nodosilinea sp.]